MEHRLNIYYREGTQQKVRATVERWQFHDEFMGEQFITCVVRSEKPVAWAIGDYCIFRGEHYFLNYLPTTKQQGDIDSSLEAFVYDAIKFDSVADELLRCQMLDITGSEYSDIIGTNYTGSSSFHLYCGETEETISGQTVIRPAVCVLAAKMQVNLDRMYGYDVWTVSVDRETTKTEPWGEVRLETQTEDKLLTFNNESVMDALRKVHDEFRLNYSIEGRTIKIGYTLKNLVSDNEEDIYRFGYGKGYASKQNEGTSLFEITKMADSSQMIVTRLRVLGSQNNLPFRYYYNRYGAISPALSQSLFPLNLQLPSTFLPEGTIDDEPNPAGLTKWSRNKARADYLRSVKGATNDAYIDKDDDAEGCAEGIREASIICDGSGDLPEVYPSIEGVRYEYLRNSNVEDIDGDKGATAFPNYGNTERIDELLGVGYYHNDVLIDDANIGDGILPNEEITEPQRRRAEIAERILLYDGTGTDDFTETVVGDRVHCKGKTPTTLFEVPSVTPGKYHMETITGKDINYYYSCAIDSQYAYNYKVGYVLQIRQTPTMGDPSEVVFTYQHIDDTVYSTDTEGDMRMPELPLPLIDPLQPPADIEITKHSDITVEFIPLIAIASPHPFELTMRVGVPPLATYEPIYLWNRLPEGAIDSVFHVFVKDMGFNIEAQFSGDTPKLCVKSGRCQGHEFEILNGITVVTHNGKKGYMLTLQRDTDDNRYFPNQSLTLSAADRFVLTGINMPDTYIDAAELRLLQIATEWLAANSETRYIYQPKLDEIFVRRNYDNKKKENKVTESIFYRLYAGLKFSFLGIPTQEGGELPNITITIKSVDISMGEGLAPSIELTLNDNIEQGTIKKITQTVDRMYNYSLLTNEGKFDKVTKGSKTRPIYFDDKKEAQVIEGLSVPKSIESTEGGVSARGIADLDADASSQPAIEAVPYAELDDTQEEDTGQVPTAFSVAVLKKQLDYEALDEYDEGRSYVRGEPVKRTNSMGIARGYRFIKNKAEGIWDDSKVEPLDVKALASPLSILPTDLSEILQF